MLSVGSLAEESRNCRGDSVGGGVGVTVLLLSFWVVTSGNPECGTVAWVLLVSTAHSTVQVGFPKGTVFGVGDARVN